MNHNKEIVFEQILIDRLSGGDRNAFTSIFEAYYKDLVMFAFTFTKEPDSAGEIVQDVFVKLWEKHTELRIYGSLKSYLLKAVQNHCLDELRRRKVRDHYAGSQLEPAMPANDTEDYLLYTELQQRLDDILGQMPGEVADTFRMNRFDGLKYHEIARQMNVSERTVESRISKALQILNKELR